LDEAEEKLALGMHVLIREGSAARNFEALIPAIKTHPNQIMFCSDDKHPDSLLVGHINKLCSRAIALGYDLFDVLQAACFNPVKHYKLPVGLLQHNAPADFIFVDDLVHFNVKQTFINGKLVFDEGKVLIDSVKVEAINKFNILPLKVEDFAYTPKELEYVIVCEDGQLVTKKLVCKKADISTQIDILKIAVVNRYAKAKVATAYIKNIGLKQGAIASSVAHDSHNIIVVGVDDESICKAVNLLVENTGGLSAVSSNESYVLPLPVAGLMSNCDAWEVADRYTQIDHFSKQVLGSTLNAPFMSLSFMALLVIPDIKLSDKGLFDGNSFNFLKVV
jgi:adenine deaminase